MTPRQRWQAVLNRHRPDKVPSDFWSTGEVLDRLKRELGCSDNWALWAKLDIDRLIGVGPRYVGPDLGSRNIWGIEHRRIRYAGGAGEYSEASSHPMAGFTTVQEVAAYPWPSVDDYDFSGVKATVEDVLKRGYPVYGGHYEPFLIYCQLRGMEQAMMDLVAEPAIVEAILDRLFSFHWAMNVRLFEAAGAGRIDITYVAEDLGSQESLLMSEAMVDRYLKPKMKRMVDLAHQFGIKAFYHSDGAVRPLLDGMAAIGLDVLNPIQWRCAGM